ncbi:MAG TPA: c-type cytochrome [Bryobacteraceae bacterium]|jgi:putative heme-binding domain-containing protein|nr:c-type cytochrome [Bryobacteraceae bacterium]
MKFLIPLLVTIPLLAQHGYTPADVETGARVYRSNCSSCHGPNGDLQPGVDLGHGKFRRANSDEEVASIIMKGIPGTGMPPGNFSESQALTIVAYLRSLASASNVATVVGGDPAKGREVFESKGGCLSCHRVRDTGSRVGPDLTDIGMLRRTADLQRSLTDPDAEVLAQNRYFRVVTKAGATVTGRLLNEDTFSVQLLDSTEHLRSFKKADLKEYSFVEKSTMPSYKDKLTAQELSDVVGYLTSLKGL